MKPSAQQVAAFAEKCGTRPVMLFVQSDAAVEQRGADLRWSAHAKQVLVGDPPAFAHAALLRFDDPQQALAFARNVAASHVAVLTVPPRRLAVMTQLLAWLAPILPLDDAIDPQEEPGIGTSGVMPTREAIAELKGHSAQDAPVTMVNWLKFRDRASYYRYGKVALMAAHRLRGRLLYAGRYRMTLVGNDGDPGLGLWDEFVLMRYPGRAAFVQMTSLARYRRALPDREAGLTARGQGLVVTEPAGA